MPLLARSGHATPALVMALIDTLVARYGPWAVVTGASDGIGKAFARLLAEKGFQLILVARRQDALDELATSLRAQFGICCEAIGADLSNTIQADRFAEATLEFDVGLLVSAAGFGTSGPFLDGQIEVDTNMLELNCVGVLRQCEHFGRRFRDRGRGAVVLMSSVLAFQGVPGSANYAASKAYVQSLAEGLRHEWAGLGIDVIASAPGPIATGFARRANLNMKKTMPPEIVARETLAKLGSRGTVRPGWLSKALGWSLSTAPRALRVLIMAQVMKDMTAHHATPRSS